MPHYRLGFLLQQSSRELYQLFAQKIREAAEQRRDDRGRRAARQAADFTVRDRDEGDRANGDTSANAFMFTALYVFDGMGATGAVQPYLGGGIGGANVEMSAGGQDFDAETLLAYQLIGGVGYELNPNVSLYAEARWFQTESGEFDGPSSESFNGEFETFDLLVGMRYVFSPAM